MVCGGRGVCEVSVWGREVEGEKGGCLWCVYVEKGVSMLCVEGAGMKVVCLWCARVHEGCVRAYGVCRDAGKKRVCLWYV